MASIENILTIKVSIITGKCGSFKPCVQEILELKYEI